MKKVTLKWLKVWGYIFLFFLGFPTLGFTWCVWIALVYGDPWRIQLILALELWLHWWRKIGLILAGFPTLGYTWFLVNKFDEPLLHGLRMKYSKDAT